MKALVVYESMFGNSERVAVAVASGLGEYGEVVLRNVGAGAPGQIPVGVDLLVAGGPTHAMSMSRPSTREDAVRQGAGRAAVGRGLREWLGDASEDLHGLAFTTFDTRVSKVRRLPGSAAKGAARALHRRHGRLLASPESFYVGDVAGPLDPDEVERATAWGRRIGLLVEHGAASATV
jgi:hypothetical protein